MKVGCFWQFVNEASMAHLEFARLMLKSARAVMPDVEVWQLTDGDSPELEGVDGVHRIDLPVPMAVRRMLHNANLEGDWLFIDPDIIIQKDVRHVFDEPFDVALTDRIGTITYEAEYAKAMPYNLGVSFSRSPKFWQRVLRHLGTLPAKLQHWEGDQLVVCAMLRQNLADDFKVKILPGLTYNFPPKFAGDGKDAALVHYKGPRKSYLMEAA